MLLGSLLEFGTPGKDLPADREGGAKRRGDQGGEVRGRRWAAIDPIRSGTRGDCACIGRTSPFREVNERSTRGISWSNRWAPTFQLCFGRSSWQLTLPIPPSQSYLLSAPIPRGPSAARRREPRLRLQHNSATHIHQQRQTGVESAHRPYIRRRQGQATRRPSSPNPRDAGQVQRCRNR